MATRPRIPSAVPHIPEQARGQAARDPEEERQLYISHPQPESEGPQSHAIVPYFNKQDVQQFIAIATDYQGESNPHGQTQGVQGLPYPTAERPRQARPQAWQKAVEQSAEIRIA